MLTFPEPLSNLIRNLAKLPGVGTKSAQRFAFHILSMSEADTLELAEAISRAKTELHVCPVCGMYTANDGICDMCGDTSRTQKKLCVVSSAKDVFYMDDMRDSFNGKFHVLGGVLSPLDGIGPDDLNLNTLPERVRNEQIDEVIIATNPDVEGDATASYIAGKLKPLNVKVTRLAYGLPMGMNIEYADALTLSLAMDGRREL